MWKVLNYSANFCDKAEDLIILMYDRDSIHVRKRI